MNNPFWPRGGEIGRVTTPAEITANHRGEDNDMIARVTSYAEPSGSDRDSCVFSPGDISTPEQIVPCFTPGTMIATMRGEVAVEELVQGDRVITRDNGFQEIRWIGEKHLSGRALLDTPELRPVLIRAGALGDGYPAQDILLSPNHRVLRSGPSIAANFGESEVLAAARHMIGLDGVDQIDSTGVTYIHFMFDRHEIVLSNGAWTESFQPCDYCLRGVDDDQRNELFQLFPELQTPEALRAYGAARRSVRQSEIAFL